MIASPYAVTCTHLLVLLEGGAHLVVVSQRQDGQELRLVRAQLVLARLIQPLRVRPADQSELSKSGTSRRCVNDY